MKYTLLLLSLIITSTTYGQDLKTVLDNGYTADRPIELTETSSNYVTFSIDPQNGQYRFGVDASGNSSISVDDYGNTTNINTPNTNISGIITIAPVTGAGDFLVKNINNQVSSRTPAQAAADMGVVVGTQLKTYLGQTTAATSIGIGVQIANNTTKVFRATITARSGNNSRAWVVLTAVKNNGGNASIITNTPIMVTWADTPLNSTSFTITAAGGGTPDYIALTCTGIASTTIDWWVNIVEIN